MKISSKLATLGLYCNSCLSKLIIFSSRKSLNKDVFAFKTFNSFSIFLQHCKTSPLTTICNVYVFNFCGSAKSIYTLEQINFLSNLERCNVEYKLEHVPMNYSNAWKKIDKQDKNETFFSIFGRSCSSAGASSSRADGLRYVQRRNQS